MPDSLLSQLVNDAWDKIKKAVDDGLSLGGQKTLDDLVTVLNQQSEDLTSQPSRPIRKGNCQIYMRQSATATEYDYLYKFPLGYQTLRSPDYNAIKDWAAEARVSELAGVLGHLAVASMRRDYTVKNLPTATAAGWGPIRCVTFKNEPDTIPLPDNLAAMDWDGPVKVDLATPEPPIQALIFRLGGGPFVQRQADLTLGWIPGANDGVNLVLTEQLQIINATKRTITGIHLVSK